MKGLSDAFTDTVKTASMAPAKAFLSSLPGPVFHGIAREHVSTAALCILPSVTPDRERAVGNAAGIAQAPLN